ncbi:MAG: S-layer homology domain-containing protein [Clostridiales bacterium]|jgi:hypothetical protein|nr:S-layer homology domain-containing protein [Clostridiales bacterium]
MMIKTNARRRALALALALAVAAPFSAAGVPALADAGGRAEAHALADAGGTAEVPTLASGMTAEAHALADAGGTAAVQALSAGGTLTVPAGETALRVPVSIADIGAPCAGIELTLPIEGGGGLSFAGFSVGGSAAGANVLGPTRSGGVAYFGFYAGENIYTGGDLELRFLYTGDARHSVAVAISQIIRLNADRDGTTSSNVGEALLSFGVARETGDTPGGTDPGENNPGGSDPGENNPGGSDGPGDTDPGDGSPGGSDPGGPDPGGNDPGGTDPGENNPGGSDPSENNPGGDSPGGNNPGGGDTGTALPPAGTGTGTGAGAGAGAGAAAIVSGAFTDIGDEGVARGAGEEPAAKTRSAYFDDVDESWPWAVNEIDSLYERGVVKGTAERIYSPAAPIKRGDFMLMLARAYSFDAPGGEPFPDVPEGSYYYGAIHSARALGVALGDGEGFKPESPITRQDMMALVDRTLRAVGTPLPEGGEGDLAPFGDSAEIAGYARASVSALVKSGLIKGRDTGIAPREATTRAEMAVLVHRMLNELP